MNKPTKNGTCKLCGEQGPLCFSHILPEFFYKPAYDESHSFMSITSHPQHKIKPIQKGFREYLLCRKCEDRFMVYENYVSQMIEKINAVPLTKTQNIIEIGNYNYRLIKLFGLSLIWRCHISSNYMFGQVKLNKHAETIHKMLVEEDPGSPHTYCFCLTKVTKDILQRTVMPPSRTRFLGHNAYIFLALGIQWVLIVSSHSNSIQNSNIIVGAQPVLHIPVIVGNANPLINFVQKKHNDNENK